jgi:hypothetical protein
VRFATTVPCRDTSAACEAFEAISAIEELVCSAPAAIVYTPALTASVEAVAMLAFCDASVAPACNWLLTADNSSDAADNVTATCDIRSTL